MQSALNRMLLGILLALILIIAAVTALSFALKIATPGKNVRAPDPEPAAVTDMTAPDNSRLAAFTGLGRLRAVTKPDVATDGADAASTTVILTPWFAYPEGDTSFYEELARKTTMIRALITQYFSQYTEAELLRRGEEQVKADLLAELNARLSLNKIQAIYFSEYVFLE